MVSEDGLLAQADGGGQELTPENLLPHGLTICHLSSQVYLLVQPAHPLWGRWVLLLWFE